MESCICRKEEVTIEGAFPLKGTMTIPEGAAGKRPAVLFIVGSGKIDGSVLEF